MGRTLLRATLLATAGLSAMAAHGACAQTAEPAAAPAAVVEEVVVTAQRRSENLQKAAVAVSAVGEKQLVAASVTETQGLSRLVPSLQVQPSGGGSANFYLRGVGTLQSNAFAENAVAFNFAGVYLARPTAPVGSFYDLERVEVVKGPQGTLYGRNATGGALNVLPARPRLGETSGDVTLELGNYASKKAQGSVNLPLGDKAALRLAGQWVDRDGYMSDGYDDENGKAARASLLVEPSETLSVLLIGDYFKQGGKGVGGTIVPSSYIPGAPSIDERVGGADARSIAALSAWSSAVPAPPFCAGGFVASGCVAPPKTDGYIDSTFWGLSAQVEAKLPIGSLTIIPAYRRSEPTYRNYSVGFLGEASEVDEQTSLEVRLASLDDQAFRYVVGGYYFEEDQDTSNYFYQGTISTTRFTPKLSTKSKAVFGQATYDLSSTLRLVVGARYTNEKRSQATALASGGLPGAVNPPLGTAYPGSLEFNKTTGKVGLEWDVAERSLLYANVSTGFKAGGFFVAAPPKNTFAPEKITAYTIGSKNRFFDNRLQLNAEAFHWKYKDQQISFVGGITAPSGLIAPGAVTVNAGQASISGVEVELQAALTSRDRFSANVQYLHGKYDELVFDALSASGGAIRSGCAATDLGVANPTVPANPARLFRINCSGKQTINSPEWTANASYEHTMPLSNGFELLLGLRTRLESSRYVAIDYLPEERQKAYTTTDAYVTLTGRDARWSLTGFVNNIEDETVISGAISRPVLQVVYATLKPPRTYGARLNFNF